MFNRAVTILLHPRIILKYVFSVGVTPEAHLHKESVELQYMFE